ncbi:MAG: PQQ-binding-like beta-propeller repeat protein [Anaerolineae bacterium]|nr:PQQ-binding-like beta-propeller repeat protein [Anaerolineae bacterium]
MTRRSRIVGAGLLLLLVAVLSACGAQPVAQNWPGLTVGGGRVYVISGLPQQVYILDAETGVQQATFVPSGGEAGLPYWSPVTLGGDLAFVGFAESQSGTAGLYAFDPETGQERWNVPANDLILPAPTYADGTVYFGGSDGQVYAVDVESQRIKEGWPFQAEEAVWASPLVAGGQVYVASMDHNVYALDADTGQELWRTEVGGAMAAKPVMAATGEVLYVGAFDGRLYALRADSGEQVEGFDFKADNWIWSEVLLANDLIFVTSLDGRLYALNPSDGSVVSPYPYDSAEVADASDGLRASPVLAGETIIVTSGSGRVIAVKDAQRQWYWPSGLPQSSVYTTPVVSNGWVYVLLMDGQVQVLDSEDGGLQWSFSPPESQ